MKKINAVLVKDIFREILRSKAKFCSIILMIALGIFVSVGMKITSPIMKKTILSYMDAAKMYDYKIVKNGNISISEYKQINDAITNDKDFIFTTKRIIRNKNIELSIQSFPKSSTIPMIVSGHEPKTIDEILLDSRLAKSFKIGDKIECIDFNENKDLETN